MIRMTHKLSTAIASSVIVAALSYPLCTWLLARSVPGYSHLEQQISELGVADLPYGWLLTAVLVVNGLLVIGLAFALRATLGPYSPSWRDDRDQHRWAFRLLLLYAAALLIGGLFPCDVDCRPTTWRGAIHVVNLLPSMIATLGAPFVVARRLAEEPRLALLSSLCFTLGILTSVAVVAAFGVFPALQLAGLGQRIVLTFQLGFFVVVAFALIHQGRHSTEVRTPDLAHTPLTDMF